MDLSHSLHMDLSHSLHMDLSHSLHMDLSHSLHMDPSHSGTRRQVQIKEIVDFSVLYHQRAHSPDHLQLDSNLQPADHNYQSANHCINGDFVLGSNFCLFFAPVVFTCRLQLCHCVLCCLFICTTTGSSP